MIITPNIKQIVKVGIGDTLPLSHFLLRGRIPKGSLYYRQTKYTRRRDELDQKLCEVDGYFEALR